MLTATDTIPALAQKYITEQKDAAKANYEKQMAGAKNNIERLMVAGVIVTCDEQMENSYREEGRARRARELGISLAEVDALIEQENAEQHVKAQLKLAVQMGETVQEHEERVDAAMAAAPKGIKKNGKPCSHKTTQKERGWINAYGCYNHSALNPAKDAWDFVCCRCGTHVVVPVLTTPTSQAGIARAILVLNHSGVE